jgi:hypothetical protein
MAYGLSCRCTLRASVSTRPSSALLTSGVCYLCIGKMVCLLWLLRHLTINLQIIVVRQESAVALVGRFFFMTRASASAC